MRPIGDSQRSWSVTLVILLVATLAVRSIYFGDPLIDGDEQFYLLVGDRLLHGALPYVDIWDRKPVGLFLLFAAIRLLGGAGSVQYQIVAGLFVAGTVLAIAATARRLAGSAAGLVAGLFYLLSLASAGGAGGQSPIFYNLLVALAGWLIVGAAHRDARSLRRRGIAAMALVGVALQIKYSVLVEGVYFGLALGWLGRRAGMRRGEWGATLALWAAIAVLPTALALGYYAARGQTAAFVYANVVSVGQRGFYGAWASDLLQIVKRLLPLIVAIAVSQVARRRSRDDVGYALAVGWAVAAVAGFLAFGSYFNHYALPLLVPLAILAGLVVRAGRVGVGVAVLGIGVLAIVNVAEHRDYEADRGGAAHARAVAATIARYRGSGCLYVYYGDPIYYQLTQSCLPTPWAFPYHLSLTRELPALGVDAPRELARILATRPTVILVKRSADAAIDPRQTVLVTARLERDYRLVGDFPLTRDTDQVWALTPR